MLSLFRRGRKASSSFHRLITAFCIAMLSSNMLLTRTINQRLVGPMKVEKRLPCVVSLYSLPVSWATSSVFPYAAAWVSSREYHRESFFPARTGALQTESSLSRQTIIARNAVPTPFMVSTLAKNSTRNSIRDTESPNRVEANSIEAPPNHRAQLLNDCLDAVLMVSSAAPETMASTPSQDLMEAALSSLRDPSAGYDPKYGRPALRAYRSFVYPKKEQEPQQDTLQLEAAAKRTANQIDFLVKRQNSRRNQAVRNHDDPNKNSDKEDSDSAATKRFPITIVLDNLRGSFNVGSIFRTAEACGVSEILTCGITPHPFGSGSEKVAKSALGADLLVPTSHFATTYEALHYLKGQTPKPPFVVALETTAASKLYTSVDYRPYYSSDESNVESVTNSRGIALILGNEVTGVDVDLLEPLLLVDDESNNDNDHSDLDMTEALVDAIVELPTHGQKNSLNVAAVAPVILYEILRQWGDSKDSASMPER